MSPVSHEPTTRLRQELGVLVRVGDMLAANVTGDHQQEKAAGAWKVTRSLHKPPAPSPKALAP